LLDASGFRGMTRRGIEARFAERYQQGGMVGSRQASLLELVSQILAHVGVRSRRSLHGGQYCLMQRVETDAARCEGFDGQPQLLHGAGSDVNTDRSISASAR